MSLFSKASCNPSGSHTLWERRGWHLKFSNLEQHVPLTQGGRIWNNFSEKQIAACQAVDYSLLTVQSMQIKPAERELAGSHAICQSRVILSLCTAELLGTGLQVIGHFRSRNKAQRTSNSLLVETNPTLGSAEPFLSFSLALIHFPFVRFSQRVSQYLKKKRKKERAWENPNQF